MTTKMKKWHAGATKRRSKYKNRTVGKRLRAKRGTKHNYTKRGGFPEWMKNWKKCWPWCNRQQSTPEEAHTSGPVPVVGGPVVLPSQRQGVVSPNLVSPVVVSPPAGRPSSAPRRVRRGESAQPSKSKYTPVFIESLNRNWRILKLRIRHNIQMHKINSEIPILIGRDEFHNLTQRYNAVIEAYKSRINRINVMEDANVLTEFIKEQIMLYNGPLRHTEGDDDDDDDDDGPQMPL